MKSLIGIALLLIMAPTLASAQDKGTQFPVDGYLFIGEGYAPVGFSHDCYPQCINLHYGISQAGGGGEIQVSKGFGVGSELGVMGRPGYPFYTGLFSINPFYRFRHASAKTKLVPFADAGLALAFRNEIFSSYNLFNFGGGIDYWVFKRVGLRLEFRDYVDHNQGALPQYPTFRIGLVLR